jgi:hypothetical protein
MKKGRKGLRVIKPVDSQEASARTLASVVVAVEHLVE